jgi:hypothetical protein
VIRVAEPRPVTGRLPSEDMSDPQPPDRPTPLGQPLSPDFRLPPMTPVRSGGFDDPQERKKRMRLGIIGAIVGFGIPLLAIAVAIAIGLASGGAGSDRWLGTQILLLAATVSVSPLEIITGIVLAAVQRTRPFGVGFLIGSAVGLIIMAGACFGIPAVTG